MYAGGEAWNDLAWVVQLRLLTQSQELGDSSMA